MSLELNWNGYGTLMSEGIGEFKAKTDDGYAAFVRGMDPSWEWEVWKDRILRAEGTISLTRAYTAKRAAERAIKRLRKAATP